MSTAQHHPSLAEEQSGFPVVHLTYVCIPQERSREAATPLYEIVCSITYPNVSAHLSVRVTGQHTYRNAPARELPLTRHEAGATTYVELLEREQVEVRIVEHEGEYANAVYYARGQVLTEQHVRRITCALHRIDAPTDADGKRAMS